MLELNVDYSLLNRYFGITFSDIYNNYQNMKLSEILEVEAEKGNKKAEDCNETLSNPDKLIEIFKLSNVENKYLILQNLNEQDTDKLLPFLTNEQLALGLQFFEDDKLLSMCRELPQDELVEMIFEQFSLDDVLAFMDDEQMNTFLKNVDVKREYSQKYFENLRARDLEQIMMEQFGAEAKGKSKNEYLQQLMEMDDNSYQRFTTKLQRDEKIDLINGVVVQDEKLLYLFDANNLVKPMDGLLKKDKIKMMEGLEQKSLIPMIQELPIELTQLVLTQIDERDFAEILADDYQDILKSVVLLSTG